MTRYKITTENIVYGIMGSILLWLVAKEAYSIPLTHDELSTIDISQKSLLDIITYSDPVPNNHILNTIFLKLNIGIFGEHLFTNRLHNVLSFILFYIYTVLTSRVLFKESWLRMAMVSLIALQPYLLDFYSVTRGYGLSVAFQMVSLYYFFNRLKTGTERSLWFAVIFGAIGVYANFTLLNVYLPMVFLLAVHAVLTFNKEKKVNTYRALYIIGGLTAGLGLLCYLPFSKMMATRQFVYWGTNGFVTDTVKPLIISLRAGTEYAGLNNDVIVNIIITSLCILIAAGIVLYRWQLDKKVFLYAIGLLFLVVVYNNIQFLLAGIPFLNARTALFFIPLVSIAVCFGLEGLIRTKLWLGLLVTVFTISFSIQHFVRGFNGLSTYEWYNDADTHVILRELKEIIDREKLTTPVKVDVHWIFHPSMSYHIRHEYSGLIELLPYHKEINTESQGVFYYTQSDEVDRLTPRYNKLKDYGWGSRVLMRLK